MLKHRFLQFSVAALAAFAALGAAAQAAWPDKPIRVLLPFPPGGPSDIVMRLAAEKMQVSLKQTIVIDNKPGAGGNLGADAVARAPADGYTLLLFVNSYTINTSVYKGLTWDAVRDFAPDRKSVV